jgi:hypothetical protein
MTMMRSASLLAALALGVITGCDAPAETSVLQSALTHGDRDNPNPPLYEKDAHPFGASMETWSERWWRWNESIPDATNPNALTTRIVTNSGVVSGGTINLDVLFED